MAPLKWTAWLCLWLHFHHCYSPLGCVLGFLFPMFLGVVFRISSTKLQPESSCSDACRGQRKALDPLELEFHTVMSLTGYWDQVRSSGIAANALESWAISLAQASPEPQVSLCQAPGLSAFAFLLAVPSACNVLHIAGSFHAGLCSDAA